MFHRSVKAYIESNHLLDKEDKVLVALSGGADSVALLCVLLQLGYRCEAAHCNFRLRGTESDRDETFVRDLCRQRNVPLHVTGFDTEEYAAKHRLSIEMAARELRYGWFEKLRTEGGYSVVAVAHHLDDSVETFLLNLIRGTGINGLKGIRPQNGHIVRPLLGTRREEILHYLQEAGQGYVTDSTNLQDEYTRNKIRLNLLPMMEQINPSVKESIRLTAARLEEVSRIYAASMAEGIARAKDEEGISITRLLEHPAPKSLLHELLAPLGFNPPQTEAVYRSLQGQSGKEFYSEKWRLVKDRTHLVLQPREKEKEDLPKELPSQGETDFGKRQRLYVETHSRTEDWTVCKKPDVACLDADKLQYPLTIRPWKAGDTFVPFGMTGRKRVSDYLTDRKFSRKRKDETYVVCSSNGEIAWIVGERTDNRFRIDEHTTRIVRLSIQTVPTK